MIRILHLSNEGSSPQQFPLEQLPDLLRRRTGVTWLDLAEESPETCEPILRDVFNFHPLAIYDALHETHAAKLDNWEDYLYLVLHGPLNEAGLDSSDHPPELDVFMGKRYLVTHHYERMPIVDTVWDLSSKDGRLSKGGSDHIVFRLTEEIIRDHIRMLDELEDDINGIEDRIFKGKDNEIPEELFTFKRILLKERATVGPMRDMFHVLALETLPLIDAHDRIFFRDIYEQILRLDGIVTHLRDLVTGTLDAYLSVVNNRMNDTMRLMAVITTLFLPITFITGFFGMNFFQAAGATEFWTGVEVLVLALVCMLIVPVGMFTWMKRRGLF